MKPTIVLVHGAFAESSSWDGVIDSLLDAGHPVIAAANPLRGLAADAAAVGDLVRTSRRAGRARRALLRRSGDLERPGRRRRDHRARLRCGFAPDPGESCFSLAGCSPAARSARRRRGRCRAATARPTSTSSGPLPRAVLRRRPRAAGRADGGDAAAGDPGGAHRTVRRTPLWRELPSWFVIGEEDRIIPAALQHFMAERAGAHRTHRDPPAARTRSRSRIPTGPSPTRSMEAAAVCTRRLSQTATNERLR